jgi:branched-chain amino acid transport system permease protein
VSEESIAASGEPHPSESARLAERSLLVAPAGLLPRPRDSGGAIRQLIPPLRFLYRQASSKFTILLLLAIVLAGFAIFHSGGSVLIGQQIRNALTLGAIYALVAIGYTMVYGIIELINFAHGDVFTLSGFYAIILADRLHLDTLATGSFGGLLLALAILFPLSMLAAGLTGMAIERVAYRRLRDAPRLAPLITAIGVSFLLEGIMLVLFGPDNVATKKANWISGEAFNIGGISIGTKDIFVVGTALVLMFGLGAFVTRTRLGKAMRSTAQDRSAALLCGININRTISVTFFIGSALAAAAAIIYSINYGDIKWSLGFRLGIIAFTAAVLGGIGNIVGAGIGGFLIGIIYVFGGSLAGGEWSEALIFAILVLILTFKPVGLFGVDVASRA